MSKSVYRYLLLSALMIACSTQAQVCPDDDRVPEKLQALYVKYKITDEVAVARNRKIGAPVSVVGDEIRELIYWKDYRWKRRFGKIWAENDPTKKQRFTAYAKRMEAIMERESRGGVPENELADRLTEEMLTYQPEQIIKEYDYIDVDIPQYSLYYDKAAKNGYGTIGETLISPGRRKSGNKNRGPVDDMINKSFKDANKIFRFKKISEKKSKILGYDVVCQRVKTSFKDFQQEYDDLDYCIANIDGYQVDLYRKIGKPGHQYIMQAIEVARDHPVSRALYCAPEYVRMRNF